MTLVAAISPARKAGKVSPIAAMSTETVGSVGYGSLSRVVVGGIALAVGLAATLTGLFADVPNEGLLVGVGCLAVFLGVYVFGRTISLPLSRAIGAPLPRLRGLSGELARENAMRNPKRTAAAGTALMLGVGIVVIINIFVASTQATVDAGIDRAFTADLVVDSGASANGGLDPSLASRLGELPAGAGGDRPARRAGPGGRQLRPARCGRPHHRVRPARPPAAAGQPGGPVDARHHRRPRPDGAGEAACGSAPRCLWSSRTPGPRSSPSR